MAKLVSMKIDKKDREKEFTAPSSVLGGEGPLYPYGLQLRLNEEDLAKLDETALPEVGGVLVVYAKAKVTSVSSNESTDGKRRNVELQITDLCLEDPADGAKTSAVLYGKDA